MLAFIPSHLNTLPCAMLTEKSLADGKVGLLALLQDGMNVKLDLSLRLAGPFIWVICCKHHVNTV